MSTPDTAGPAEETPERCPHCEPPVSTRQLLDLTVGEVHTDCTDDELSAYESARESESEELFIYHLKIIAAIVLLFFAFTYAYAFVWMG